MSDSHEAGDVPRFAPGERIAGRYEILSALGRGGMGSVFRVRDHELDEIVALKVLHRDLVGSAEMLARFRREVKLARRVTHKNVARTFDIGEHEGERFLTMELIEGEPLSEALRREGAMDPSRALHIAREIAEGLAAAHDAGVIHRDLKPENVNIAADRVVLMDFGIARANVQGDPRQTTGGMLGTPAYMAPEQVQGAEEIDARADIYACGAVLFEMVTGRVAWQGSSAYVVASARLYQPPPDARAVRPELSPELSELIRRCMEREPVDRFPTVRALAGALDALRQQRLVVDPGTAPPTTTTPTPRGGTMLETASPLPTPSERFPRRSAADGLREDLSRQLVLMGSTSPSYRRVLECLDELLESAQGPALTEAFAGAWQRRTFEGPFERPLLVLAALRADALDEGPSHPLHAAIAADEPDASTVTIEKLRDALARERLGFWIAIRTRRVQTNEVSRSLAWLWPAVIGGCDRRRRPLGIADIGASAGLTLVADRLSLRWHKRTGEVLLGAVDLDTRARLGFEPRPVDVGRPDDRAWLRACVWAGQRERLARLDEAIRAFTTIAPPPELRPLRATAAVGPLEAASKALGERSLMIAYQTMVRGYLSVEEREAYEASMRAWLGAGPVATRLWSTLELEEVGDPDLSCALDVHVATKEGLETVRLGRTGYHPHIVDVDERAVARLASILV